MSYVLPSEVSAPKNKWHLVSLLVDNGPEKTSYALGTWEGRPCVACRWNGTKDRPKGNPNSTGNPTWFILGDEIHPLMPMLQNIPDDKMKMLKVFLGV